jgi:hypothetical protein
MSEGVQITAEEIRRALDEEELRDWVQHQRWYASKARSVTGIDIVESITLRDEPLLLLALVQTRFATGTRRGRGRHPGRGVDRAHRRVDRL